MGDYSRVCNLPLVLSVAERSRRAFCKRDALALSVIFDSDYALTRSAQDERCCKLKDIACRPV